MSPASSRAVLSNGGGSTPAAATATPASAAGRSLAVGDVTVVERGMLRRAVSAAALGNAMEWFDFGVYSYLAVTLGKVFFPTAGGATQLLATFGTFAAAFLIRPLGGLVFGPLGDRIGRQKVLAATMIMMAAGTFAIGLIPSYATIGIWAPVLLLVARMVQGFSTGGEYGGATTFIAEYAPDRRRGFLGSWLEFGTLVGYVAGAALVTLMTSALDESSLLSWGWRLPFLIAGPLGLIGLYLRMRLEETPAFRKLQEQAGPAEKQRPEGGLRELLTTHRRALLLCMALVLVYNVTDYMLLSYLPTYLTAELAFDATHGLLVIIAAMVLMMAVNGPVGHLSDRIGRRPVLLAGCLGFLLLSVPALLLIRRGEQWGVLLGVGALCLLLTCFTGTMPASLPALFPTHVRYGAMSVGFNVSVSLFGGTTPLVVTSLINATGDRMMPAYYMMAAAVIGVVAVALMPESAGRPLPGSPPAVASPEEARELVARARGRAVGVRAPAVAR
ncbi:glycine betaine/L-proline transporter ProP [Kitasatospora herbaricolor]|uniref:Glycine betaine/L-proline transporter ProP n=1 Tax=Kitasatospora herbaricolor TaxID=68217 RepID=A0ABZ1W0D7_9ACTN|nr:glycine betaine/L-proline transporter ProP [Kitasatospora herbaricolor]